MEFVKTLLEEQKELLTEELRFAEDLEYSETKQRLTEVTDALNKLFICDVVSSAKDTEPTFAEMREEVLSNKLWQKRDGLYWHFKWGTKTLREAYKIATS